MPIYLFRFTLVSRHLKFNPVIIKAKLDKNVQESCENFNVNSLTRITISRTNGLEVKLFWILKNTIVQNPTNYLCVHVFSFMLG